MNTNHNGRSDRLDRSRERMLAHLRREVPDERVIEAISTVPRERFVPPHLRDRAYDDCALPIAEGQTISQPLMVAIMTAALELRPEDRVLEVGTGSGYQAAVLSSLAREVITVERHDRLREGAAALLIGLGYSNVRVYPAGHALGRPEDAPYDAIVVTAGAPHVPRALLEQLAPDGRLVLPVGSLRMQELVRARKTTHGVEFARLGACGFVPLVGREAWSPEDQPETSRRIPTKSQRR
ncbi:MAG: protein-L-isoaspartate(D-aspartate) O-methyltransferase [Dehalococcoidia bacterium]